MSGSRLVLSAEDESQLQVHPAPRRWMGEGGAKRGALGKCSRRTRPLTCDMIDI
jgi:hypothetical protein